MTRTNKVAMSPAVLGSPGMVSLSDSIVASAAEGTIVVIMKWTEGTLLEVEPHASCQGGS